MELRRAQGDSLGQLSKGAGKGLAVGLLETGTMGGKRMTGGKEQDHRPVPKFFWLSHLQEAGVCLAIATGLSSGYG